MGAKRRVCCLGGLPCIKLKSILKMKNKGSDSADAKSGRSKPTDVWRLQMKIEFAKSSSPGGTRGTAKKSHSQRIGTGGEKQDIGGGLQPIKKS